MPRTAVSARLRLSRSELSTYDHENSTSSGPSRLRTYSTLYSPTSRSELDESLSVVPRHALPLDNGLSVVLGQVPRHALPLDDGLSVPRHALSLDYGGRGLCGRAARRGLRPAAGRPYTDHLIRNELGDLARAGLTAQPAADGLIALVPPTLTPLVEHSPPARHGACRPRHSHATQNRIHERRARVDVAEGVDVLKRGGERQTLGTPTHPHHPR